MSSSSNIPKGMLSFQSCKISRPLSTTALCMEPLSLDILGCPDAFAWSQLLGFDRQWNLRLWFWFWFIYEIGATTFFWLFMRDFGLWLGLWWAAVVVRLARKH